MAYTNIDKPEDFFNIVTYTGDGSADQSMTGVGFKPDFLWIKRRNASERHVLTNVQMGASSGAYKWLDSSDTHVEFTGGTGVASFDSDGFTIKTSDTTWNASGSTYVFWSWKANGGTTSNLSGNLASVVQVNQAAGFSIVTYTGSGGNGQSVNHGLGLAPEVIMTKARNGVGDWYVYHKSIGTANFLKLNTTAVQAGSSPYVAADPNSTAFFVSANLIYVGELGADYISYCFSPIQGYSKFGSYIANANADGPFVYTGFKPAWILRKATTRAEPWMLMDNKRSPINQAGTILDPSSNAGDATTPGDYALDFLSNGFKVKSGNTSYGNHTSGVKYIYMAFAENPFVTSTGIPATAN